MSKDGISYSFDHRANGYGRSEGVCCLVLRSERTALACADPIRATIRQIGVNHCGRSQGISLPNGQAQVALIRQVYKAAGLNPADTICVEAHGECICDYNASLSVDDLFYQGRERNVAIRLRQTRL